MQAFREDTDAWLIPPMYVMVHNVRQVACQADDEAARLGRKSDALENCGTQLQKCFAVAVQGAGAPACRTFGIYNQFLQSGEPVWRRWRANVVC